MTAAYDDTIEALEKGHAPYFAEDHGAKKHIEWTALQKDLLRVRRHTETLTALKPEHTVSYREMRARSEQEIAAKAQKL